NALFFFAHGSFEASERKRSLTNDSFRASLARSSGAVFPPRRTLSPLMAVMVGPVLHPCH
ncbi:MAG: hypothetical protein KZQ65_12010, partial [Candidatus Thiodiazotropha sp. (ex Gloverina cf. vestifex)]|nr:hypothetical protein [Candidatus Thiodiazotropha sp. (ex Gloverina cf. vestifex)]